MSNDDLRVVLPNLEISSQIQATGTSLINVFAADLFDFIDKEMKKNLGVNWLLEMQVQTLGSDLNLQDPSVLLKELARKGQSPLRKPLNAYIPQANLKDFYNRLDELLGERHIWVHNSIKFDAEQLKNLTILVQKVAWKLELPVVRECQELLDLITPDEDSMAVDPPEPVSKPAEIVETVERFTQEEDLSVGSPVAGPFISYSYTLHLNGSIRDRSTDELLEDVNPGAQKLGALLIARKPNGGRLRVVADGTIAAYFGDSWGFLARVESKDWFPGHL
jgi:hypothetical protein